MVLEYVQMQVMAVMHHHAMLLFLHERRIAVTMV
jgi:hypothetical protein